jgi:hypothetical protein
MQAFHHGTAVCIIFSSFYSLYLLIISEQLPDFAKLNPLFKEGDSFFLRLPTCLLLANYFHTDH